MLPSMMMMTTRIIAWSRADHCCRKISIVAAHLERQFGRISSSIKAGSEREAGSSAQRSETRVDLCVSLS